MSKTLAGTLFVYMGETYDYNYMESIQCLLDCCDYVVIAAGGEDGTLEKVNAIQNDRLKIIEITQEHWDSQHGKEKLAYFTNICIEEIERLGYMYHFSLQADEIIHEKSYPNIRKAIESNCEGYMCCRINLWQSPYMQLDVPQERKPCSTSVIRLAKSNYRSMDDSENLGAYYIDIYYESGIKIYHMGFVRKREVMKAKITNMQVNVFGMSEPDAKLKECDTFNPKLWFSEEDLKPIDEPLPKLIQQWARERYYED